MKKVALIIHFLFILAVMVSAQEDFRKKAPAAGPAPKIQLGTYEEFTLKNGLKVIMVENHKLPRISFQVFVDVPLMKEGDYAGTADMAGQLLKTGTKTKTKAQIDAAVDFIGASIFSSASGITGSSLSKHKDKLLELMTDVLYNPVFPQEEFDKLKKQTLSGLAASKDDPNSIAQNVANVMRYGKNHPYGELTTETTVENITLDRCKTFYNTYFKPNISYLVIVGDIKVAEAKVLAEKYFGKWQKGEVAKETFATPQRPGAAKVDFVNKTGAVQSVINITYPIDLKPGTPDVILGRVMNAVMGGYFGSRLMQNIREDKGYTYGASSTLSPDKEIGYFNAGASVRNEVTDSSVVEFLYEMKRLSEEKVPESELTMVKNVITGSFARSLENPETVASFALNTARYNLPKDYYATYLEKLNQVSAEDVMAMAKKYLTADNAHIVVVGNKSEVADKLKRFTTSGEIDYFDIYGNKIEITSTAVGADMNAEKVIEKYLAAIGGKDKVSMVKDLTIKMTSTVQGMTLESNLQQKAPNKMIMSISMGGMVMQQQKFDGTKGVSLAMGQKQNLEGKDLEDIKIQAIPFAEAQYSAMGFKLMLKGIEQIEGKNAYQIDVESATGSKFTEFYDTATGFKVRTVSVQGPEGNSVTVITDYSDYKEINGVKMPYKVAISGTAPFPIVFEVTSIEVNKGIEDSVFAVE